MNEAMRRWTDAMREARYEAAWDIATRCGQARDPRQRDDPERPYHERWVWDGSPIEGRDVLVRCYRGLGDTIQFARYLPYLAQRAARVSLEVQPSLIPLLRHTPGIARIVPFDPAAPMPPSECDVEVSELDQVLRLPPPPPLPIRASPALLPAGTVALCHRSGGWDRDRDIPSALLRPICLVAPCITLAVGPSDLPVLNPEGCPQDIAITASLIAGASLVITVDTMVAHLAGSLGKPTWLMLRAEPDWRWSPSQGTSPWYPSMRLYSQPSPGAWEPVVKRIHDDISHDPGFGHAAPAGISIVPELAARPDLSMEG